MERFNMQEIKQALIIKFRVGTYQEVLETEVVQLYISMGNNTLHSHRLEFLENLYRLFVGILPGEDIEYGPDCINGINIFKYNAYWQIFGVNSDTCTTEQLLDSYAELVVLYPRNPRMIGRLSMLAQWALMSIKSRDATSMTISLNTELKRKIQELSQQTSYPVSLLID